MTSLLLVTVYRGVVKVVQALFLVVFATVLVRSMYLTGAVGGLSLDQAARTAALGALVAVIGAPLAVEDREFRPGGDDEALHDVIAEFVRRVKAGA